MARVVNIILRPEQEWPVIALEHAGWQALLFGYLVPLALISPLAYGGRVLLGGEGSFHDFPTADAALRFVLLSASGGFLGSLMSVLLMALALWLVVPLYGGRRDFADAMKAVIYASTPVWLAGIILIMPLNRFPLLVIAGLIEGFLSPTRLPWGYKFSVAAISATGLTVGCSANIASFLRA